MSLLGRIADVRGVGQHVGSIYIVDGLSFWKGCQVLVVQHLLPEFGLTAHKEILAQETFEGNGVLLLSTGRQRKCSLT